MARSRRRRARSNPLNPWVSILIPTVAGAVAGAVVQNVIDGNSTMTPQAPLAGAAIGALAGGLGEFLDKEPKKALVGLVAGLALGAGAYTLNQAAVTATSNTTPAASQLPGGTTSSTTTPNPTTATPTGTTPAATG